MTKDLRHQTEEWVDVTLVTSVPLDAMVAPPGTTDDEEEETGYGCPYVIRRGSKNYDSPYFGPDEHCEEPVGPGEEYCARHTDDEYGRDFEPDDLYDSRDAPQWWEP